MHGIVEALGILTFFGTALAAFVLRLSKPPKPVRVMFLVGCWPLPVGLASEGIDFFDAPELWVLGTAITLPATWLGSMLAAVLLRRSAKRGRE